MPGCQISFCILPFLLPCNRNGSEEEDCVMHSIASQWDTGGGLMMEEPNKIYYYESRELQSFITELHFLSLAQRNSTTLTFSQHPYNSIRQT